MASTGERKRASKETTESSRAFLIRISDHEARKRAIMALLNVREQYHGLPDYQMLVGREHIEVLEREGIKFETLS